MPFDGRSVVVEDLRTNAPHLTSADLTSGHRSGSGSGGGDMDSSSTDRMSTVDSETGTSSSVDVVSSHPVLQLNNICSVNDQSDQTEAGPQPPPCNKAPLRAQGELSGGRVDNGPMASTSKGGGIAGGGIGGGGASVCALSESLKHPRKSLPLLPRMSQYERHPLLQVRSGTGMSEFEMFLLEKELFKKRCSVDDQHSLDSAVAGETGVSASHCASSSSSSSSSAAPPRSIVRPEERKLIPRSAHYESHPLLRKSVSGVCELELYLMEKEEEVNMRQRCADMEDDDDDDDDGRTKAKKRQGRSKLEPRLSQWEKHALLEVKDKAGLSEVDRLFLETEQQEERGKCGAECVCKSATCKRCKKQQQQQNQALKSPTSSVQQNPDGAACWKGDSSKTSDDSSSVASAAPLLSSQKQQQQPKRVHFERQKNETDDSGIASSDASCPATSRQDDVGAAEVSNINATYGQQLTDDGEDRNEMGDAEETNSAAGPEDKRNKRTLRTDKQQSGNKSCCMS